MSDSQLRVLQLVSNLQIGGAQQVVRTLAENLAEAGCRPVVAAFRDGPLRRDIEALGIPVEILSDRRYSAVHGPLFVADVLRIRRAMADLLRRHDIDVVQTHLLMSLDFLALTLRGRAGPLVFWTVQNTDFTLRAEHLPGQRWLLRPKRAAYRLLYRAALRRLDGFIAVSEDVRAAVMREIGAVPDEKIAVIYNSVDLRRYQISVDRAAIRRGLGLPEGARVASMVATCKRQKGHSYLIEAAGSLVARRPDLHILLIGDGELRGALEAQARAAGVERHIHFLGSRLDVPELLAASDYFVLPSLWEGLSMALVEAMAAGLPVVATAVSGSRQVMLDGETGLLVPPADPQQLAAALQALLDDPERARAMGAAARRRVERAFSAQKQAADHIALYRRAGWRPGAQPMAGWVM
jgi:glycosyltransferase involved in cell wall biosynthesis